MTGVSEELVRNYITRDFVKGRIFKQKKTWNFWVFLERESGIIGVPFGRTELSLRLSWIEFRALFHRRGPEVPGVQGMSEKSFFFQDLFANQNTWETSEFFLFRENR